MAIDYHEADETGKEVPLVCSACGRPTLYDYADDSYHHAVDAARGCSLLPAEPGRPDDPAHPLVGHPTPLFSRPRPPKGRRD